MSLAPARVKVTGRLVLVAALNYALTFIYEVSSEGWEDTPVCIARALQKEIIAERSSVSKIPYQM